MSEPTDDRIIDRMRSALDELTADVDAATAEVVPVRAIATRPGRRSAWLGMAAATVLLAGTAVWALSTRIEDPVASPDDVAATSDTIGVSTSGPFAPPQEVPPSSLPAPASAVPSFTIISARLSPGPVSSDEIEPTTGGPFFATWRIDGEDLDGFLFASVNARFDILDGTALIELDPPTGRADLLGVPLDGAPVVSPWIWWTQTDGSVWAFQQQGLSRGTASDEWIELVFTAVPGSGVPIVIPDERASLISLGGVSSTVVAQAFTSVDAGTVDLTVTDGGAALGTLVGADEVREVQIAGRRGWLGRYPDGHVEVVWEAAPGWWGLLGISPDLADQADDIIASVVRTDDAPTAATVAAPDTAQRYRTTASIIQTGDGPPMIAYGGRLSNPPQGGGVIELAGLDWSDVPDAQTLNGTTWSGTYDLVGTVDGSVFTLTEPPSSPTASAGPTFSAQVLTADCTEDDVQPALDALRALDAETLGFLMTGDDRWDGRCGVFVWALLDTPELRAALAPLGDQVRLEFALTPL